MNSKQLSWIIKREAVDMTNRSGASHIASILSVSDIVAVLMNDIAVLNPKNPADDKRDRIILSKGHAGVSLYVCLALKGFFDVDILSTYEENGSILSGHVSHKTVPGVDFSTGSLGHGLSVGSGMAYALLEKGNLTSRVFVILGDGECDEGSVWESALVSNHFNLGNLIAVVDHNKMQSLDYCEKTLELSPFESKWKSFGWNVVKCQHGNNTHYIKAAFKRAIEIGNRTKKPTVIIADTVKGSGISFMENNILWHYRYPHDGNEYEEAVNELNESRPKGVIAPCEVKK
ncbi:MAG: transketolase [Mollicutes bacterium]|nr:transketolase [Mollicutes bacterium]